MYFIKLALRKLKEQKAYTSISVIGLSIAFVVSLVIFSFVHHHLLFDKNIDNNERSYRITSSLGEGSHWAPTFAAFDGLLNENLQIEKASVFYKWDETYEVENNANSLYIKDPVYADADFVDYFNINVTIGDAKELRKPNTVLISEKCANTLFKGENPIGKSIHLKYPEVISRNNRIATVVGVVSAKQRLSHLKYDIIHSKKGFLERTITRFKKNKFYSAYAYLTLLSGVNPNEFEEQLIPMVKPVLGNSHGPQVEDFKFRLQPISDIHFTTGLTMDISQGVKKSHLNILLVVGCLVFLTALFNFIIMVLGKWEGRAKQQQIIKSVGANRLNVLHLDLLEIGIPVIISVILSIGVIVAINPVIGAKFLSNWQVDLFAFSFWQLLAILAFVTISIPLCINLFSSIRRSNITSNSGNKKMMPLIVLQFAIVIGLISYSLSISRQLNFIDTKDIGYNAENVMIFRTPGGRSSKINVFKEKARTIPGVVATANCQHYPGFRLQNMTLETKDGMYPFKFTYVDEDALELLGIKTVETIAETENTAFYINETFYNSLSKNYTKEAIINGDFNTKKETGDERLDFYVNGIVKDFHYQSLYHQLGNFCFFIKNSKKFNYRFMMVRFKQGALELVENEVQNIAAELYGVDSLDPVFLNEALNKKYQSEAQLLSIANLFTILTALIACMGLIAFTLFTIKKRTKEIGVRKVNGAKVGEILALLNKDFIKWVIIAFVIATPVAYYAMTKWLENFAYKTELSWWIFALAGVVALGIALLTVSWQSWKAATRNPVEALRYE